MTARPIRLSIHALGGQGGGVLAEWIVDLAEAEGWIAQATSVPGVAQRTGATVYYLELAPAPPPGAPEPVMALMPSPGDVDVVVTAELMEAGRALARGLVTPDRTVLVASSHRVFAIDEKMAMGDGVVPPARVLDAAGRSAKRLVMADYARIADAHGAVISAPLFGALAGAGVLPFPPAAFERAIERSGKGVARSLAAFAAALRAGDAPPAANPTPLPPAAETLARIGRERLLDYQGPDYARLYDERLAAIARADRELGGEAAGGRLTAAAARRLALWMSAEDVIRVADLKTRAARFDRVRAEARVGPAHAMHVSEYLHPRFEELCELLPPRWGERLLDSARARAWTRRLFDRGRVVTTSRLRGFLLLWTIARLRRWRPRTLRYAHDQRRIVAWLESAVNAARHDYDLGVEVLRLQRLVKGYGDTHARGLRNFALVMGALPDLLGTTNAATRLRALHEAALADEEGRTLARALGALHRPAPDRIAA